MCLSFAEGGAPLHTLSQRANVSAAGTARPSPWVLLGPQRPLQSSRNRLIPAAIGRLQLRDAAFVLVFVFFGVAGAIPGVAPNQASAMTGTPASHLQALVGIGSQLLVDTFLVALVLGHAQRLVRHASMLWAPCLLGVWALLSVAWSVHPWTTCRRALPFLLASVFGALLPLLLPNRRLLALLLAALGILALWSAVLAVGFPVIGLDASTGHAGDWQGAFSQKNACGRAMVLALAAVFAAQSLRPQRTLCMGLLVIFAGELVCSGSRGAWLIAGLMAVLLVAVRTMARMCRRLHAAVTAALIAGLAGIAAGIAENFARFAPLLGRDATLSGRTAIWHQVWIAILARPWFGYGFSAFWQGFAAPSWKVVVALHFVLFHAHNGFLEIWLELGSIGLMLFLATFFRALVLLWPALRGPQLREAIWPLSVLLLTVLYDLDENTLLAFNGLFWVLYAATLVQIERMAAQRRCAMHPERNRVAEGEPSPASGRLHAQPLRSRNCGAGPWL
jgi:exopolysaccharide production protein ExoQ